MSGLINIASSIHAKRCPEYGGLQNRSNRIRRGINHVYSILIIKPQIELSSLPHVKIRAELDSSAGKILDVGQMAPASVAEVRERRFARAIDNTSGIERTNRVATRFPGT